MRLKGMKRDRKILLKIEDSTVSTYLTQHVQVRPLYCHSSISRAFRYGLLQTCVNYDVTASPLSPYGFVSYQVDLNALPTFAYYQLCKTIFQIHLKVKKL